MNALITVIIPYLNEERWVSEAMQSVVEQTYRPIELIMVNDGSSDDSQRIVESMDVNDISIQYLNHSSNRGLSAARNTAYLRATGEYITYLDADDRMFPDRLVEMYNALTTDTDVDVVIGKDQLIIEQHVDLPPEIMLDRENGLAPYLPSLLCHRSTHEIVGGFDTRFKSSEDVDWFNRATLLGVRLKVTDILAIHRRFHGKNMSYQSDKLRHFRLKSVYEINMRRRKNIGHRVDFESGLPDG